MNFYKHQKYQRLADIALVVGAPLSLAIVELFHPHPHDLFKLNVQTWLAVSLRPKTAVSAFGSRDGGTRA